jgi:hypothetical protein
MAFGIARRVIAAAIVLRLDVEHDLGTSCLRSRVMRIGIFHHDIDALRRRLALVRRRDMASILVSTSPSMIMPLPRVSSAWATLPPSAGTTIFRSKPKAWQSQSIAAAAFR